MLGGALALQRDLAVAPLRVVLVPERVDDPLDRDRPPSGPAAAIAAACSLGAAPDNTVASPSYDGVQLVARKQHLVVQERGAGHRVALRHLCWIGDRSGRRRCWWSLGGSGLWKCCRRGVACLGIARDEGVQGSTRALEGACQVVHSSRTSGLASTPNGAKKFGEMPAEASGRLIRHSETSMTQTMRHERVSGCLATISSFRQILFLTACKTATQPGITTVPCNHGITQRPCRCITFPTYPPNSFARRASQKRGVHCSERRRDIEEVACRHRPSRTTPALPLLIVHARTRQAARSLHRELRPN